MRRLGPLSRPDQGDPYAPAGVWSGLLAQLVADDAIEHASRRELAPRQIIPDPSRPPNLDATVRVLYERRNDVQRQEVPRATRSELMRRIQSALTAYGVSARSSATAESIETRSVNVDGTIWTVASERLDIEPKGASMETHFVIGHPLVRHGELAPEEWRSTVTEDEYREDAEIELRLPIGRKNSGTYVYIRAGARINLEFLRGLHASATIANTSGVNPIGFATDVCTVPHVIRGDAAAVMQGLRGSHGRSVESIDVTVSRDNISSVAHLLVEVGHAAPIGQAGASGWVHRDEIEHKLWAMRDDDSPIPLHSDRWGDINLTVVSNHKFAELLDESDTYAVAQGHLRLERLTSDWTVAS